MKKYFPITLMAILILAVTGCSQEGDQAPTVGDSSGSGEVSTAETGNSLTAVEHTTLKPDNTVADDIQEADAEEISEDEAETEQSEDE